MPHNQSTTPPISLIVTILNEQDTVQPLLAALNHQTHLPQEVIIVDGGSSDGTLPNLTPVQKDQTLNFKLTVRVLPNSSRSQARNWAIAHAKHELIAVTDAGCIPQPSWLEELVNKYEQTRADIVAGYFYGLPETAFQQAVVAYTLITPNRIDPNNFMPTTRSVLFKKQVWKKVGGFDDNLPTSEDFVFFTQAKQQGFNFTLAQEALVGWLPREDLAQFIKMIFEFAAGDTFAGIWRKKVKLVFARYLLAAILLILLLCFTNLGLATIVLIYLALLLVYLIWAIAKNIRYVPQGWYYLPLLQLIADVMVMAGSLVGWLRRSGSSTSSGRN